MTKKSKMQEEAEEMVFLSQRRKSRAGAIPIGAGIFAPWSKGVSGVKPLSGQPPLPDPDDPAEPQP